MKTEPDVYSIDDLMKQKKTMWEGVRNYQARNFMRDQMRVGDLVLIYHSNTKPPGIVGTGKVCSEAYPDPTQFDSKSNYYDAKSKKDNPRWELVDIAFDSKFSRMIPLDELKEDHACKDMYVIRKGMRLSIQPVTQKEYEHLIRKGTT